MTEYQNIPTDKFGNPDVEFLHAEGYEEWDQADEDEWLCEGGEDNLTQSYDEEES